MHGQHMLTLPQTGLRSSQGHALYIHCSTLASDASCQVIEMSLLVSKMKIFEGFLPYMGMAAILVM